MRKRNKNELISERERERGVCSRLPVLLRAFLLDKLSSSRRSSSFVITIINVTGSLDYYGCSRFFQCAVVSFYLSTQFWC